MACVKAKVHNDQIRNDIIRRVISRSDNPLSLYDPTHTIVPFRHSYTFLLLEQSARDVVTCMNVRVGHYLSHCNCKGKYLPCEFSFLFQ
ncbi:UNVERIFIED_CONTAM: hypothetical protein NCL1_55140 [Trichonephila clavipes]